jgi:hypothetical protein
VSKSEEDHLQVELDVHHAIRAGLAGRRAGVRLRLSHQRVARCDPADLAGGGEEDRGEGCVRSMN